MGRWTSLVHLVAVLVAAFALAGAAPATRYAALAHDVPPDTEASIDHDHANGNAASMSPTIAPGLAGLRVEWASDPTAPQPGHPITLVYRVVDAATGRTVSALPLVHERPMHLFVVSRDLAHFDHLHPGQASDGSYRVALALPAVGTYLLFDEFAHGAHAVLDRRELIVGTASSVPTALAPNLSPQTVDGVTVALDAPAPIRAGEAVKLTFTLTEGGQPVTDLVPWLGAAAHVAIVSVDEAEFAHAHGEAVVAEAGGHAGHGDHAAHAPATFGPAVQVERAFAEPGRYKVWAQFSRDGQVFTVAFVVEVA